MCKIMNIIKKIFKQESAQSLVEVVIAIGLLAIVFTGSWQILHGSYMSISEEAVGLKAHYLVVEGVEGIRSIRDEDWNKIIDGTWHFEYDETDPESKFLDLLVGEESVWDIYSRRIEISSVRRDPSTGKITENEIYDIDPDTKLVEIVVQWQFMGSTRTDIERIYLTKVVEMLYG